MDILIAFVLLIIAVGLFTQKPICVEVKHKYDTPQPSEPISDEDYKKLSEEAEFRNDVAAIFREIMGGEDDEE